MTTLEEAKLKTLIAYTGYNPFAQDLPIAQLNAASMARSNPSKQFQAIQREVEKSGGWWERGTERDEGKTWYTVISGPYTGEYQFHHGASWAGSLQPFYRYRPSIGPPYVHVMSSRGDWLFGSAEAKATDRSDLEKLRAAKLEDLLKVSTAMWRLYPKGINERIQEGIYRLIAARTPELERWIRTNSFASWGDITGRENTKEAWDKLSLTDQRWIQEFTDQRWIQEFTEVWDRGWGSVEAPQAFVEYWKEAAPRMREYLKLELMLRPEATRLTLLYSVPEAQILYVLSQAAGVPIDQVIVALAKNSKRVLSIPQSYFIPTRMNDRVRYACEFLRTWSPNKALRVLFPNVEGKIDRLFPQHERLSGDLIEPVRWGLNYIPSPRQLDLGERSLGKAVGVFRKAGGKKNDWAALLRALRRHPAWRDEIDSALFNLSDLVARTIPRARPELAENLRGRQIIEAAESPGPIWVYLLKEQAYIDALYERAEERERILTQKEMQKKNSYGKKILKVLYGTTPASPFPGTLIRPLVTPEDFEREGREMHHCARGYFWREQSLLFAFRDSAGNRATMEYLKDKMGFSVVQFLGPRVMVRADGIFCQRCEELVYDQATLPRGEEPRVCGNMEVPLTSELGRMLGDFRKRADRLELR